MRKKSFFIICSLFIFITCSFPTSTHFHVKAIEGTIELTQQLNHLISNEPDLKVAIAGISIRNASNGEIIYSKIGDTRLKPASNLKLFTAAAALSVLGEKYTFKTEILTDGSMTGRVLNGHLFLKGMGDPTLLHADFDEIAKELKNAGIDQINGDLVGDDSWYDDLRYSRDLTMKDQMYYYGGAISALTVSPNEDYDAGSIIVEVKPSDAIGKKPSIKMNPQTNHMKVENHARTVADEQKKTINITREHNSNTVIVTGEIPKNSKRIKEWVAVLDPTQYALQLFKQSLEKHDIQLTGDVSTGKTPEKSRMLKRIESEPLSEILIPFMKLSNNVIGEMLVKELGKVVYGEGSWDKGIKVLKAQLQKFGVQSELLVLRDGSGLSHVNLIPANELSSFLFAIQKEAWFHTFLHSLPVSGAPERMLGGTLRNRMINTPAQWRVRAKTGSLATVSSLSGYIDTENGERLIFSIILNNLLEAEKGKAIEDRIVVLLAEQ
ncbi:D-alanyl-D-alanine carboxypeptidase/D-alanyl-D-alanine-endopeptidase (penicillin-binding protein 4) [Cytobacillus eiseniae]|uniref:D-alanyl-D-alanine carboxypeptidase/D-alanyl-D-alanine-endopeptidase (Penicillin-binding protein 4) n=1 Tax=Cytobacillus eiseniae TaxID=762947 RepID=A0ABS4RA94_9BACI|nr:D-alanyl-D-alanine carboxypeptidase/D-alanyl-D-alanine-endopeptidase [Cytobacillus eiseniae]MBP2239797.1 D-alanyl-D-alanine carboxypeptidase/D-alanyl-D-alanine-endopeptidase (penicillin-binding protein 4) [Cytobacillus eiseniae]